MPWRSAFSVRLPLAVAVVATSVCTAAGHAAGAAGGGKTASILVDRQMRRNAVRNVERFEWARAHKERLEGAVAPFLELDPAHLWSLLPSQEMGRAVRPNSVHSRTSPHEKHCPQCYLNNPDENHGPDRHAVDLLGRPWQVQCLRCRTWYPKNDFASYYRSALDDTGRFRIGAGDPGFLEPMEGVEGEARKWIEDGTGLEFEGFKWFYAGVYAERMWRRLAITAENFATLYTLTENPEYARRAAIILDRMADFYPEMDELPGRELGMMTSYAPGRIMGRGWEYTAIRRQGAIAYDYIYDAIRNDSELIELVDRMSREYNGGDKSSFAAFNRHLRENLLVDFAEDIIRLGSVEARGRDLMALTLAAVALDDPERTPRFLDWMLKEDGGRLPFTLLEHMHRDGFNVNSGLGYMTISGWVMYRVAEALRRYNDPNRDIYSLYPNLMNSFTMLSRVRVLDRTAPAVGDGGGSMAMGERRLAVDMLVDGYLTFGSPAIAREIAHQFGGDLERAAARIVYAEDPDALMASIRQHLPEHPVPHQSYNSGGTGLAVMQAPSRVHERAAALWYGRSMWPSHAHADRLTLHLWAFGEALMPDMGYPEHTGGWPKRHGFTRHTISHNTLMINDTRQGTSYSGKTRLFAAVGPLRVADVDGLALPRVDARQWAGPLYEGVETYRRAVAMVDVDEKDSYLLDVFWARGGTNHRLIQNSGSGTAIAEGLTLVRQDGGTFAGAEVGYGQEFDGRVAGNYAGSGFQYLENVERDGTPAETFRVVWPIDARYPKPENWRAHMRLHNLTQVDEVALADGIPPRGHPDRVQYLVRSRLGEDLHSQFITVIEPYAEEPFIERTRVLARVEERGQPFAAAVEVVLRDGRRDLLLIREEAGTLEVDNCRLDGRLGMVRFDPDGRPQQLVAVAAGELRAGSESLTMTPAAFSGELVDFDDSDPHNVLLVLSQPVTEEVIGRYIIVDNVEVADPSYRIEALVDERTVNLGQMPIYERLADPNDFSAGVLYNIRRGERYIIPGVGWVQRLQPAARAPEVD